MNPRAGSVGTAIAVLVLVGIGGSVVPTSAVAQDDTSFVWAQPSPRAANEGEGPFNRLIITGARIINGTGTPPSRPTTIVIERNRIVRLGGRVDAPGPNDKIIDVRGGYVIPGMIDTHVRILSPAQGVFPTDYPLKLLLAHGITTVASMQDYGPQTDWALELQKRSAANAVVAPRLQVWAGLGMVTTPEEARQRVRAAYALGVRGSGESALRGSVEAIEAGLQEMRKLGMRSNWHMSQPFAVRFNALDAARVGLDGLTHWYALIEALLDEQSLQRYPDDYDWGDVRSRFRQSGRFWKQAAKPGSPHWNKVLDEFRALDFTFEPTFSVYEANRDVVGVSRAEWHDEYLHPALRDTYVPNTSGLFSHFYDWTSTDEAEWRTNFQLWMAFVNAYKNRGGRVVAGTDAGYMWTVPGFSYIRNLEMLEEAGFSTLEVLSSATLKGAEHLQLADQLGTVEVGKLADLVVLERNPLDNLKEFYGTGYISLRPDSTIGRIGGVRYTIKDGIVYDAKALLADVRKIVTNAKNARRR